MVGSHWPRLKLFRQPEDEPLLQADKGIHFVAFAGLTWLLIRARFAGRGTGSARAVVVAGCVALVYAGLDELTQVWADRDATFSDFAASAIGVFSIVVVSMTGLASRPEPRGLRAKRVTALLFAVGVLTLSVVPGVTQVIQWTADQTHWPEARIDQSWHFLTAGAMTWLLARSFPGGAHRPRLGVWVTILAVALSAPMMVTAQRLMERGVGTIDIYAHELGLFAALGIWALCLARRALDAADAPGLAERTE